MNYKDPFIKVEWEDTPENLTQERIKRVKEYFKKKYNTNNVNIITKVVVNTTNTKLKSLDVSESILDPVYQKTLVKDFITENKIDIKWEMIDRLDNRVSGISKKSSFQISYLLVIIMLSTLMASVGSQP